MSLKGRQVAPRTPWGSRNCSSRLHRCTVSRVGEQTHAPCRCRRGTPRAGPERSHTPPREAAGRSPVRNPRQLCKGHPQAQLRGRARHLPGPPPAGPPGLTDAPPPPTPARTPLP